MEWTAQWTHTYVCSFVFIYDSHTEEYENILRINTWMNESTNGLAMCSMNGGVSEGVTGGRNVIEEMKKMTP